MSNLIKDILHELREFRDGVTCFVDALDECEQSEVNAMLKVFKNLIAATSSLRVCFACRHYPDLPIDEERLASIALEKQAGHTEDLRIYVKSNLKIGHLKDVERCYNDIVQKCDGVFIYCELVIDIIGNQVRKGQVDSRRDILDLLSTLPGDLNRLFMEILTRDTLSTQDRQETALCLQWVLFYLRDHFKESMKSILRHDYNETSLNKIDYTAKHVTPGFFWWAIHQGLLPPEQPHDQLKPVSSETAKRYILDVSRGLLEVTESYQVQVIHESVREFLLKEGGLAMLIGQDTKATDDLIAISHQRLQNICQRTVLSLEMDGVWETADAEIKAFQVYAVRGLFRHADLASNQGYDQTEFLQDFQSIETRKVWVKQFNKWHPEVEIPEDINLQTLLFWQNLRSLLQLHYSQEEAAGRGSQFGLKLSSSQAVHFLRETDQTAYWINYKYVSTSTSAIHIHRATPIEAAIREDQPVIIWNLFRMQLDRQAEASPRIIGESRHILLRSMTVKFSSAMGFNPDLVVASPVILLGQAFENHSQADMFCLLANLTKEYGDPDKAIVDWSLVPCQQLAETMLYLLRHKVCPYGAYTCDVDKADMLHWAIAMGHTEIACRLIKAYGVEDCRDRRGRTPLHISALHNNVAVIKRLVPLYTAEPCDNQGKSPFTLAWQSDSNAAFQALRRWRFQLAQSTRLRMRTAGKLPQPPVDTP